jgi:hypothetical protein
MKRLVGCLVLLAHLGCATPPPPRRLMPARAPTPPVLPGAWQSACLPIRNTDDSQGWVRHVHGFTATLWSTDTTVYVDSACMTAAGSLHSEGAFTVTGPSTATPGAWDVQFDIHGRSITPAREGFVAWLSLMECGDTFRVGRTADMFDNACPAFAWAPVPTCVSEFDVIRVEGPTMWRGRRTADVPLCTQDRRPLSLGDANTRL